MNRSYINIWVWDLSISSWLVISRPFVDLTLRCIIVCVDVLCCRELWLAVRSQQPSMFGSQLGRCSSIPTRRPSRPPSTSATPLGTGCPRSATKPLGPTTVKVMCPCQGASSFSTKARRHLRSHVSLHRLWTTSAQTFRFTTPTPQSSSTPQGQIKST